MLLITDLTPVSHSEEICRQLPHAKMVLIPDGRVALVTGAGIAAGPVDGAR